MSETLMPRSRTLARDADRMSAPRLWLWSRNRPRLPAVLHDVKPGAFAVFLFLLLALGAAGGGVAGYALHAPNPLTATKPSGGNAEGLATTFLRGMVGTETMEAAYEESRRRWAAGGAGAGALLGLLSAGMIGSYSLRYRASGR